MLIIGCIIEIGFFGRFGFCLHSHANNSFITLDLLFRYFRIANAHIWQCPVFLVSKKKMGNCTIWFNYRYVT